MTGILSVIAPAISTQLTTVAAAKAELGLTDSSEDATLSALVDRASAVIAAHCGRVFGRETVSETFRRNWVPGLGVNAHVGLFGTPFDSRLQQPLVLQRPGHRTAPTTLQSVTENGVPLDPAADYEIDQAPGLVYRLRNGLRSWWGVPVVVVTYAVGWALPNDPGPNLPADIEGACLSLVRSAYFARGRDPNVALDMLNGDRTQFWDRSVSAFAVDEALAASLADYVVRGR